MILDSLESFFKEWVVASIDAVLFFDVAFWDNGSEAEIQLPIVVLWLVFGALFFTLRFQFINFRGFLHGVDCVRGRYSRPGETGDISHFQALSAALSATVGLGNIAGVAFAVGVGGPGAVLWMVVAGFLGMSSKFVECTLGQKYRVLRSDGRMSGGPMHYLRDGLAERGLGGLGRFLSVLFALMCIGGSFGGGNMYQSNQAFAQVSTTFAQSAPWLGGDGGAVGFGLILALAVGAVIIGGIKRIGQVAAVLVPIMCVVYVASGLLILTINASAVPSAIGVVVTEAFSFQAGLGGFVGVLIQGFRRAAFSNEAGVGSAAIAHSAAQTDEPVREGLVALLEPFIDTIIVCAMTGAVIVVTGAHANPDAGAGIQMTSFAFATVLPWFPVVLSITAVAFAFSTMISWSYYGEQCWVQLFGLRSVLLYKLIFLLFTWAGAIFAAEAVVEFGDLMILGMAFPNIAGILLLTGKVKADLDDYMRRLAAGEFPKQR
ncbi:MAG: alanine/glycine:cation symporter family protein [Myxococcota bacterium]|nr:alanine/glycine:cation symporter family protein [Myxococcota bacterium]